MRGKRRVMMWSESDVALERETPRVIEVTVKEQRSKMHRPAGKRRTKTRGGGAFKEGEIWDAFFFFFRVVVHL